MQKTKAVTEIREKDKVLVTRKGKRPMGGTVSMIRSGTAVVSLNPGQSIVVPVEACEPWEESE